MKDILYRPTRNQDSFRLMGKWKNVVLSIAFILLMGSLVAQEKFPWEINGSLIVKPNTRTIQHENGRHFLWIGCTAWGMTEWLSREEVIHYLDDRKSKSMNVVQLCLLWGKREEYPTTFTPNAPNAYGHTPFKLKKDGHKVKRPLVIDGGNP